MNSPLITSKSLKLLVFLARLLAICLLNLINIIVLCTVKSMWPYFQHICQKTKIIIVFPNHVFLETMVHIRLIFFVYFRLSFKVLYFFILWHYFLNLSHLFRLFTATLSGALFSKFLILLISFRQLLGMGIRVFGRCMHVRWD